MKESKFAEMLREKMPVKHWYRIENSAGAGIPDVSACHNGCESWLELKIMHGRKIIVRHSQMNWWLARAKARGPANCFVVALDAGGKLKIKSKYIKVWHTLSILKGMTAPDADIRENSDNKSFFIVPPPPDFEIANPYDWDGLRDFLFRPARAIMAKSGDEPIVEPTR